MSIAIAQERSRFQDVLAVIGGSLLIALFARISIPLPFTPVPIALQPHVCLFLGALLGPRRGALAVLLYLAQGAVGLPVFALGRAGWAILMGPTGGYLMGYAAAAYLVGYLFERMQSRTTGKMVGAFALGSLLLYSLGVAQLSVFLGLSNALFYGVVPFLAGDVLKIILATWGMRKITSGGAFLSS